MKKHYLLSAIVFCCTAWSATTVFAQTTERQPSSSASSETKPAVTSETKRVIPPSDATDPVLAKLYNANGPFAGFKPEQEILSKRGKNTKHFQRNKDEFSAVVSPGMTHYWEDNTWKTSSNEISKLSDPQYAYGNVHNPAKVYFGNIGTGLKMSCPENIEFKGFAPVAITAYDHNRRPIAALYQPNTSAAPVLNEKDPTFINYSGVYPSGSYQVEQRCNNFVTQYVIEQNIFTNLPANTGYVGFTEKMELPVGSTVEYRYEKGKSNGFLVKNNGNIIFTYTNARYWCDTAVHKDKSRGGYAKIDYSLSGNMLEMRIMIPAEWLQSPKTHYPITIDPVADLYSADFNLYGDANSATYGVPNVYNSAYASTGTSRDEDDAWSNDYALVGWVDDYSDNDFGGSILAEAKRLACFPVEFALFGADWITNNQLLIDEYFGLSGWDFFSSWSTRVHSYMKFPLPNVAHPSRNSSDTIPRVACINGTILRLNQSAAWDGGGEEGMHFTLKATPYDPQQAVAASDWAGLNAAMDQAGLLSTLPPNHLKVSDYDAVNAPGTGSGRCPNSGNFPQYMEAPGQQDFNVGSNQMDAYLLNLTSTSNFVTFTFENICRGKDEWFDETAVLPFKGYSFGNLGPHLIVDYTYGEGSEVENAIGLGIVSCGDSITKQKGNFASLCLTNSGGGTNDDYFYKFDVTTSNTEVSISTCYDGYQSTNTNLILYRQTSVDPAPITTTNIYDVRAHVLQATPNATYVVAHSPNNCFDIPTGTFKLSGMNVTLTPGTYYLMVETSTGSAPSNIFTTIKVNSPVMGTVTHSQAGIISATDSIIDFCAASGGTLTVAGASGNIAWKRVTRAGVVESPTNWSTSTTTPSISQAVFPPNTGNTSDYAGIQLQVSTGPSCPVFTKTFIVRNRYNPPVSSMQLNPAGAEFCAGGLQLGAIFPGGNQPNLFGRIEFFDNFIPASPPPWNPNDPIVDPPLDENAPSYQVDGDDDGTYDNGVWVTVNELPNYPLLYSYSARYNATWDMPYNQVVNWTVGCPVSVPVAYPAPVQFTIRQPATHPTNDYIFPDQADPVCVGAELHMKSPANGGNTAPGCETIEYYWSTTAGPSITDWHRIPASSIPPIVPPTPPPPFMVLSDSLGVNYTGPFYIGARRDCGVFSPAVNAYGCTTPELPNVIATWTVVPNPTNPTTWTSLPTTPTVCTGQPLLSVSAATGGVQGRNDCKVLYRYLYDNGVTVTVSPSGTSSSPAVGGQLAVPSIPNPGIGTHTIQVRRGDCDGCTEPDWVTMATWTVVPDPGEFTPLTATKSPNLPAVCSGTPLTITSAPFGGEEGVGCEIEYGYAYYDPTVVISTGNTYPLFSSVFDGAGLKNYILARRVNCQTYCEDVVPWTIVAEWEVIDGVSGDITVVQTPPSPSACAGDLLMIDMFDDANTTYPCDYEVRITYNGGTSWSIIASGDLPTVQAALSSYVLYDPTYAAVAGDDIIIDVRRTYCDLFNLCTFQPELPRRIAGWIINPIPTEGIGMVDAIPVTLGCTTYSDTKNLGRAGYNSTCYADDGDPTHGLIGVYSGLPAEDVYYTFTLTDSVIVNISTCNTVIDPNAIYYETYLALLDNAGAPVLDSLGAPIVNSVGGPLCGDLASIQTLLPPGQYFVVVEGQMLDVNGLETDMIITTEISYPTPDNFVQASTPTQCYGSDYYFDLGAGGAMFEDGIADNLVWSASGGPVTVTPVLTNADGDAYGVFIDLNTLTSGDIICSYTNPASCITVYSLTLSIVPQPLTTTGTATYCNQADNVELTASIVGDGTIYWFGDDFAHMTSDITQPGFPAPADFHNSATTSLAENVTATTTTTYYFAAHASDGLGECWNEPVPVVVTVSPKPDDVSVTVSGTASTGTPATNDYCANATLTPLLLGTIGDIHWLSTDSNVLPPVAIESSSPRVVNASGNYYFRSISDDGCLGDVEQVSIVINALPSAPAVSGFAPWCQTTNVLASGHNPPTTELYFLGTNPNAVGAISDGDEVISAPGNYYFRIENVATGCRSNASVAPFPAGVKPNPPTVAANPVSAVVCEGATITLTATPAVTNPGTIYWLSIDSTSNGIVSASQTVDTTGTYYFRSRSIDGCRSNAVPVSTTVHQLPVTPTLSVTNTPNCTDNTVLTSNPIGGGETTYFQGTTSGGTSTTTTSPVSITSPGTATYYFRARNNTTGCFSNDTSVTLTVYQKPGTPVISGDSAEVVQCGSATLTALSTPSGTMYYFGTNQVDSVAYTGPIVTQEAGVHYFQANNNGCKSNFNAWPEGVVDTVKLPATPTVATAAANAFGYHCVNVILFATDSASRPASDSIYWQGGAVNGVSTATKVNQRNVTSSGTYYFRARDKNTGCWSNPAPATVLVDPNINITVVQDGCAMNGSPFDKENIIITTTGGTIPHVVKESGNTISPFGPNITSAVKLYQVPVSLSGFDSTYYFSVEDAVGCIKTAPSFTPSAGRIDDIPQAYGAVAALDSAYTDCYSKGLSNWLYFRTPGASNSVFAAINDNGQDLGTVFAKVYFEPTEPTIGNIHPSGTCTGSGTPMKALRRHFVLVPDNQPSSPVGVRLFFSKEEVEGLIAATAGPTTPCDSTDVISAKEDLHVIKYHGSSGYEQLEDRDWFNNYADVAGIYTLFGPNAANPRNINGPAGADKFHTLFKGTQQQNGSTPELLYDRHYADVQTNQLSEFWLGGSSEEGSALPVEMIYLEAEAINNSYIQVRWATATEINNDYFNVERSTDAQTWTQIAQVDGRGDANGNSTVRLDYSYNDLTALPNVRYYYRLKQVDNDAQFEYTGIVSAILTGDVVFTVKDFLPNPASDKASLIVTTSNDQKIGVDIYNVIGEKVMDGMYNLNKGANKIDFDFRILASGTYTAIVTSANEIYTKKLVITR